MTNYALPNHDPISFLLNCPLIIYSFDTLFRPQIEIYKCKPVGWILLKVVVGTAYKTQGTLAPDSVYSSRKYSDRQRNSWLYCYCFLSPYVLLKPENNKLLCTFLMLFSQRKGIGGGYQMLQYSFFCTCSYFKHLPTQIYVVDEVVD